jgi:NAD(P)-dependent dehydrogenase (short-subunit alcohol dehydrogenase family)
VSGTLSKRTAIVTGGGSGIGEGVAIALADAGARVIICGRRYEALQLVAQKIEKAGGICGVIHGDVSIEDDAMRIIDKAIDAYGSVDILINNAGIYGGGQIHDHDIQTWDRVLDINLRGPFLMARAALPLMRDQKRGHIINISSESGIEHYPANGAYGVSKHALNALSEYIQRENQEYGIRVDVICPGMVVTEMTDRHKDLNREKCLQPADIVDLVMWLLDRRPNIKIGTPILIQTMMNPWEG